MGIVSVQNSSALTPSRSTTVTLDTPETVVIERGIRIYRSGVEIAKRAAEGTANEDEHKGMKFWQSGCWTLEPLQYDISNIQETTAALAFVIRAASFDFLQVNHNSANQNMFVEMQNFAQSDLTGSSYAGTVPASGDYFLAKQIPADGSADPSTVSANSTFDSSGPSALSYPNDDVPMDRSAVSTSQFRNNQGFVLRWHVPICPNTYPRYLFTFMFGQYALVIGGSGVAYLWEYCQPAGGGGYRWVRRDKWRYAPQGTAPGTAHSMGIFPHTAPGGINYLAFSDISADTGPQSNTSEQLSSRSAVLGEHYYKVDQTVRGTDIDASPGYVTSENYIRLDVRRDLRPHIQISTMGFPVVVEGVSGTLIDDSGVVGGVNWTGNTNAVAITKTSYEYTGYTITAVVNDGNTQTTFVPGADFFPQANFTFASSDGKDTPVLWAYGIFQQPMTSTASPGAFTVAAKGYNVDFAAGDPQTESASINGVVDIAMAHTRLTKRERFAGVLSTTFLPPAGDTVNVALCGGILCGNESTRKGVGRTTGGVDPAWREYVLTMSGMWDRLKEFVEPPFPRMYAIDPTQSVATVLTWKVTDALVDILKNAGCPSSQINIPDLGYRFWPGNSAKVEDLTVNPTANLADYAVKITRDYLGAYLHFEPNAGAAGQWILIFGTQPGEDGSFTPVYNFLSAGATPESGVGPPTAQGAFAADTSFIASEPKYVNRRADANMIVVTTGIPTTNANNLMQVQCSASNPLSYAVPGMTTEPDPDHPDYLGYCKKITIIAPDLLTLDSTGGYTSTLAAVQWVCRRLYNFLCHGQRIMRFRAPLVFIQDTSLSATASSSSGNWRPLRFQDPVSIDGDATWLVKSVRASYQNDRVQMAEYEIIQPYPGQVFYGFDLKQHRRVLRRQGIQFVAGFGSHSASHRSFAPAPHREQLHLEGPVVRSGFTPIQNADGSFIAIDGWNTLTGAAG